MQEFEKIVFKRDNFGNTILCCAAVLNNKDISIINILNHLKSAFKNNQKYFESLIFSTNDSGKTILHLMCEHQKLSELKNNLFEFIEWCNENLSKPQLEDFLFANNNEGKTFLRSMLNRADKNELKSDENGECLKIVCKIIIKLDETIDNKDKLKSFLEQKIENDLNFIELVSENSEAEDINFFVDWLKEHPEYPAPTPEASNQLDEIAPNESKIERSAINNQPEIINEFDGNDSEEIENIPPTALEDLSTDNEGADSAERKSIRNKCICM
jgi:hypothetical protein